MSKARKKFKHDLVPESCEYPECDYDFFVSRHRIKPGKVGGKYIPGNVIGLCPNHHVEADAGKIPQFELFQLVHRRIKRTLRSRDNLNGHTESHWRICRDREQNVLKMQGKISGNVFYP